MQTARRLYVYLISGISLGALVLGVTMLLTVLFERLGLGPADGVAFGGEDPLRQQLTLASAVTAVSLPVWLIHWLVAERSVRPDRPGASTERTSAVRGLYFALAMGALLLAAATGAAAMLEAIVLRLADADGFSSRSIGAGLAAFIVAGVAWSAHLRLWARDWSHGPLINAGAWLPRTYLYLATFAGLMILLGGVIGLIELAGRLVLDEAPEFVDPSSGPWWAFPLASAVTSVTVGGAIWLGHAAYAGQLVDEPGWRGASERPAKLRLAYYVAVLVATAAASIFLLGDGLGNALASALGVADAEETDQITGLILLPILSAVPYAIAWWMHSRRMADEAASFGSAERLETEGRLQLYPVALVGLAFAATATAWLIGILIDVALGGERIISGSEGPRRELAQFVPFALIGVAVWIWRWNTVRSRWAVDPVGEAASTTRRTMLLIVLAAGIGAGVISIGIILYRLFGSAFGLAQAGDPVSELSLPVGVVLVAAVVVLIHGSHLRRDQSLREGLDAPAAEPAAVARSTVLRLTGAANADLSSTIEALRQHLPPGYALEVVVDSVLAPPATPVPAAGEPAESS
jgi:hypothetical protein